MTEGNNLASQTLQAALAAHKAGNFKAAETGYRAYLQVCPHSAAAHMHLGVVVGNLGRRDEAANHYRQAIQLHPGYAEAHGNLAFCLLKAGKTDEAEQPCLYALQLKPELPNALFTLGLLRFQQGRLEEARAGFAQLTSVVPDHVEGLTNLASIHFMQGRWAEAEKQLRQAVQINPDLFEAWNALGATLKMQWLLLEAEQCLRRAVLLKPHDPDALSNLGATLTVLGRFEESQSILRSAIELAPRHWNAHSNLLYAMNFCEQTPEAILAQAQCYDVSLRAHLRDTGGQFNVWACEPKPQRLRVGLVSGDLREHPVGYFLENVLASSSMLSVDWYAYVNQVDDDALSERIRHYFTAWKKIANKNDAEAAALIQADGIHVLIDLAGHTAGNCLPLFARRPAPVQATWLGYFATTGLLEMDYLIADAVSVPASHSQHFTEQVVYLPETRLSFTPPVQAPDVALSPASVKTYITFGSVQHAGKISPKVITVWSRILTALPEAHLRLQNAVYADPALCGSITKAFLAHGIREDRIEFRGAMPRLDYMRAYADIDIVLDTFPYPGGTTTCEALWMGVPTLTLAGCSLLARQGASLLSAAGLSNWIAADEQDYVDKAVASAQDIEGLVALRASLRKRMSESALCDAKRFAQNLVELLWKMWREVEATCVRKQDDTLTSAHQGK